MPVSVHGFKQVEVRRPFVDGYTSMVLWLPTKGLRVGAPVPHGFTVAVVYPTTHYQCLDCSKLCSPEVVRCLCEKRN